MALAKTGSTAKLKTIAIIRLSSLGDIVHTLPAFQMLRKQFPEAKDPAPPCWKIFPVLMTSRFLI
jgi:hypothetical protein